MSGLEDGLQEWTARATTLDEAGRFPPEAAVWLHDRGLLAAPLPRALGGAGLGSEPQGALPLANTLTQLGTAWLPLARVLEGHVNALRLLVIYGTPAQARQAAADATAGHLFAIWAAEIDPVRWQSGTLHGRKSFGSAAGVVTRALVTARHDGAEHLALAALPPGEARVGTRPAVLGMGGAGSAAIDLEGLPAALVGGAGDYMRQPEISLGAWRALPGLLGGIRALRAAVAAALQRRGRQDVVQLTRFGEMLAAERSAALWVDHAAVLAEAPEAGEAAATEVKLARHAVDQACATALEHAKRMVGLSGFVRPSPVERICRDLDTYRRQPALDEVLVEAARHRLSESLA